MTSTAASLLNTTTGLCVTLAAGLAVLVAYCLLCPARWLLHHHGPDEVNPAELADLDLPRGGADCGCFWHYLPGGHVRLYTCTAHAYICTPDGEA